MRFQCEPTIQKLVWQWYDNDNSQYRDLESNEATYELEASFLANVRDNFDPHHFQYKFQNV